MVAGLVELEVEAVVVEVVVEVAEAAEAAEEEAAGEQVVVEEVLDCRAPANRSNHRPRARSSRPSDCCRLHS